MDVACLVALGVCGFVADATIGCQGQLSQIGEQREYFTHGHFALRRKLAGSNHRDLPSAAASLERHTDPQWMSGKRVVGRDGGQIDTRTSGSGSECVEDFDTGQQR
ncbi:hypothetical protein AWC01_00850 [Mycobacterium doricum]|uniref:Uncharacterized protein n=1 Tax=Mycolicibacterium doricum TaxID=126673 RepID=A0A1X1SWE9_9MYCO|nr:hypothetical protein AWC01_00850 [Mycolicibacterium doricum]